MEERSNKTIICSVFFLDIVEYSKKSVSGQISLKERFNAFLSAAIRDVPMDDRIILDTGDGAAISFLGDVEDALRAALSMRGSLLSEEGLKDPPLLVRMGVNLGPVRLVRDINGQPNIVGDGINVAQRVMGFAEPGQILVSRSYFDAASRLSQQYAGMFRYVGSRTDKHVREHEVYAIGQPGDLTGVQSSLPVQEIGSASGASGKFSVAWNSLLAKSKSYLSVLGARWSELTASAVEKFKQAPSQYKALYVGMMVIPFLLLLLVVKLVHKSEVPQAVVPVSEVANSTSIDTSKKDVMLASSAPVAASNVTKHHAARDAKTNLHSKTEPKADKDKKKDKDKKAAKQDGKSNREPAVISLTVKPWGEVYLDGKMIDVSPPLTKLDVPAGPHVIELKNANFPVYKQVVNAKAGDKIKINYKFAN